MGVMAGGATKAGFGCKYTGVLEDDGREYIIRGCVCIISS